MWELMRGTDYKPFFEHFRRAAGLSEGGYHGAKWNDGDFYKWMEAAIVVMGLTGDETWKQRIDEIIEVIGQAQREDGYLHTPVLIGQRQGDPDARPFQDRFAFEIQHGPFDHCGVRASPGHGRRSVFGDRAQNSGFSGSDI